MPMTVWDLSGTLMRSYRRCSAHQHCLYTALCNCLGVYAVCADVLHVCLPVQSPTLAQRQAAHFNATAVHASFGDVELAQITLRGMHHYTTMLCPLLS